jgi:hypothetical protein
MAHCEPNFPGVFAQNVDDTFDAWAEAAKGDLSLVNLAQCVVAAVGRRANAHLLSIDAAKPGRPFQRDSGPSPRERRSLASRGS